MDEENIVSVYQVMCGSIKSHRCILFYHLNALSQYLYILSTVNNFKIEAFLSI